MSSIFRRSLILKNSFLKELSKSYGLNNFKSIQLLKKYGLHKNCLVQEVPPVILDTICKAIETSFLADIDLKKNYTANVRRRASFKNHHAVFLRIALKKDKKDVN